MIKYIPASAAEELSNALWALSRPHAIRGEQDTQYLFPWIIDNQNNRWIVVDDQYEIPVHVNAQLGNISLILQPWIDEGYLPNNILTNLILIINNKKGASLKVYEAFPDFFKSQSKSLQQMIDLQPISNVMM